MDIIIFHGLQMRLLLEKASNQCTKLSKLQLFLGLRALFEGGSYYKNYGTQGKFQPAAWPAQKAHFQ